MGFACCEGRQVKTPNSNDAAGRSNYQIALICGGGVLIVGAFIFSLLSARNWSDSILLLLERLRHLGLFGAFLFVCLQGLVALIGFLPASLLGLAAGAVYGLGGGFVLSASGVLIGAVLSFVLTRSKIRPVVARIADRYSVMNRIDNALVRDGWRLVFLMRISPVMPFSLTSVALGLSGIGFWDYLAGTLASLPALSLYVGIGSLGAQSIGANISGISRLHMVIFGIGLVATLLLTFRIGRLLARAVGKSIEL